MYNRTSKCLHCNKILKGETIEGLELECKRHSYMKHKTAYAISQNYVKSESVYNGKIYIGQRLVPNDS